MSEHGAFTDQASIYGQDDAGSGGRGALRLAIVAALGGFLFGYDSAVINGAVSAIQAHFKIGAGELGFAVASALLGAAAGALTAGRLADRFGRLFAMRAAAVLFLASAVLSALAPALWILVVGRVIGGFGVGIASVIAPAYIAEISPARIRGRLGSMQQLAIVTGIAVSFFVDYIFAAIAGSSKNELALGLEAWRWMFLAMAVPALVYGGLSLTIPESPRYLIGKGRVDEAKDVLGGLLGRAGLDAKVREIQRTMHLEQTPSIRDLKGPAFGLLPLVWVGIGLSVFQQFVGINVIFYYSSVLWQAVGFNEKDSLIITVIGSVVNVVTTLIAIATIDKFGRRLLLLIGSIGMSLTLGTLTVIFATARTVVTATGGHQPVLHGAQGPIALVAANAFVFFFGMSWGPVVWVWLGEAFPNRIRGAALSLAAGAQWVANWIISTTFPPMKEISLALAYGFYSLCAILSIVFVLKWVRETKGMELEDMKGDRVVV